jgi:SOS-response transcriptional repressor LexA
MTPQMFLFMQSLIALKRSGKKFSREEFAVALGLDPKLVDHRMTSFTSIPNEKDPHRPVQKKLDRRLCRPEYLSVVPVFSQLQVLKRNFEVNRFKPDIDWAVVDKDTKYGELIHYFAMIMPDDDVMREDGINPGDKIIAAANLKPGYNDLVVTRIPGSALITVRRLRTTRNTMIFDLFEGGMKNPYTIFSLENLIFGVVVGIHRTYAPAKLPDSGKQGDPVPQGLKTKRIRKDRIKKKVQRPSLDSLIGDEED